MGLRQRARGVGAPGFERLDHLLLAHPGSRGQLGDRRRAPVAGRQIVEQPREQLVELLQPTGDGDRPDPVAKVALELSDDRREDVGDEVDLPLEVEAVDRLDEPEGGHLLQVFELLAPTPRSVSRATRRAA